MRDSECGRKGEEEERKEEGQVDGDGTRDGESGRKEDEEERKKEDEEVGGGGSSGDPRAGHRVVAVPFTPRTRLSVSWWPRSLVPNNVDLILAYHAGSSSSSCFLRSPLQKPQALREYFGRENIGVDLGTPQNEGETRVNYTKGELSDWRGKQVLAPGKVPQSALRLCRQKVTSKAPEPARESFTSHTVPVCSPPAPAPAPAQPLPSPSQPPQPITEAWEDAPQDGWLAGWGRGVGHLKEKSFRSTSFCNLALTMKQLGIRRMSNDWHGPRGLNYGRVKLCGVRAPVSLRPVTPWKRIARDTIQSRQLAKSEGGRAEITSIERKSCAVQRRLSAGSFCSFSYIPTPPRHPPSTLRTQDASATIPG
ncbi:hypothetical protein O3P69_008334 [Scylla paramamosain]|uniref:Uncharacterized protein n=1 Tax=Scylla paramamosain TaxID=85552 RepID=A0AAW0SJ71_SCYPA